MKKIFLVFNFLLLLLTIISLPTPKINAASDAVVSLTHVDYRYNKYAYADENNLVWFRINIDGDFTGIVTVYYRTYDISAIAEAGDYNPIDRCVTFSAYRTKTVKDAVEVSMIDYGISDGVAKRTRSFGVEIYKVEGNAQLSERNKIEGMIGYSAIREIPFDKAHLESSHYIDYEKVHVSPSFSTYEMDGPSWRTIHYDFYNDPLYSYWHNSYITSGEADIYATFDGVIDDSYASRSSSYVQLENNDSNRVVGLKTHGWYSNDRINPNLEHHSDYDWYEDVYTDTSRIIRYHSDIICDCKKCDGYNSYFYKVNSLPFYIIRFTTDGGYDRMIKDFKVYTTLIDTKSPTVLNVYYDADYTKTTNNLRFKVRFSENIHLGTDKKNLPYLNLKINQDIVTIPLTDYEAYKGTNTLCFEIPLSELNYDGYIEDITIVSIGNGDNICDYGGTYRDVKTSSENLKAGELAFINNRYVEKEINFKFNVGLQCYTAHINMIPDSNKSQRQHSVTLELVGPNADDVEIYYTWSTSKETPTEYENHSDILGGTKIVTQSGLHGKYYLHVKAITNTGRTSYTCLEEPLSFDNSPPNTTFIGTGNYKQREYEIIAEDLDADFSDGLETIYMVYRIKGELDFKTKQIAQIPAGKYQHTMKYIITAADVGVGNNEWKEVELGFYAKDYSGNYNENFEVICETVIFDTRNIFSSEFVGVADSSDAKILNLDNNVIIVKKNTTDILLNFVNTDEETYKNLDILYQSLLSGKTGEEFVINEVDVSNGSPEETGKATFKFNIPVGYYKFVMKVESSHGDVPSEEYHIYITDGDEDTANYLYTLDQYVLNNYVYQLSTTYPYFYYLDIPGAVVEEPYATKSNPASFSSKEIAYNYIYYKELSDLYAIRLNSDLATYLNSSITSYVKATGETTVAQEGQIWIRYKAQNWSYQGLNNKWVYYCYNASTTNTNNFTIDVLNSNLPPLLRTALENVSNYICSLGEYTYLVGSEKIDKNGAPTLLPEQIFAEELELDGPKFGAKFKSPVTYLGDKNIKKSTVRVNNETHILATNYTIYADQYTNIYYKRANSEDPYTKAKITSDLTYGKMINANGLYEILEATATGCKKYIVYIDKEAPLLELKWYDSLDHANTLILSEDHAGMYINATKASIHQMTREADNLAYVLLYKTSSKKLIKVITKEMLNNEIQLEDEHYTMYIYDRSGNYYVIYFRINSTGLDCEVSEVANEYIKITTNREEAQIKSFVIYCNNELLTNVYSSSLKFNKSGTYYIEIEDWYGNQLTKEYSFSYDVPSITWRYEINGTTHVYNGNNEEMTIESIGGNNYFVVSQALLQFSLDGPYSFEFIGNVPEYTYTPINKRVKLKDIVPFTVKIYYSTQPSIYVIYNVSYDKEPPEIDASYINKEYNPLEVEKLYNSLIDKETGYKLIPDSLEFDISSIEYQKIKNGDVFYSNLISLNFYDSVGIKEVYVYLDDKLFLNENVLSVPTIILSRVGSYRVVAYDVLGNKSVLEFVNVEQKTYELSIDGNVDSMYGNTEVILNMYGDATVRYLVNDGTDTYYLGLIISDGAIHEIYYYVGLDGLGNKTLAIDKSNLLFEINDSTSVDTYYELYSDCCYYSVKYDENNNFTIKLNANDEKEYYIQTRVELSNNQMYFYEYYLSKKKSQIDILDNKDNVIEKDDVIYLSKSFSIDENSIEDDIAEIRLYYSNINVFDTYKSIYINNTFENVKYDTDGFYKFEVINIYNNVTTFVVIVSNTFNVTSEVAYKDGQTVVYSNNYSEVIRSNSKIILHAFTNEISVDVVKDDRKYTVNINKVDNGYSISFNEVGEYQVKIVDQYGNEKNLSLSIKSNNFNYVEDLIYGYNEDALLKDNGYTNKKLSINSNLFSDYNISKVSIIYEENEYVVYDKLQENTIEKDLFECVGFDNKVGLYKVCFRDAYGNLVTKDIHYSDVTTLTLSRTTRNAKTDIYDINQALEKGFWSNMSLNFESSSKKYIFEINGVRYDFPKMLSFDVDLFEGDKVYTVNYLDEYGFKYEFNAYLSRKEISLGIDNKEYKTINNIITVNDAIKLIYDKSLIVYYTIDSLNKKIYEGEDLVADGVYRFEAVDLAGNIAALTIAKDTYVYYDFYESSAGKIVINGGIVNSNRVVFRELNDDTSYIEKVYRNGEEVKDFSNVFMDNGHYEIIISDEMNNKEFFSFYIITTKLAEFDYKTPQYYKIVEVLFDRGDGVKNSYLEYVDQYDNYSHIQVKENGSYQVKVTSILTGENRVFNFTVDNSIPNVELEGVEVGGNTINDVYIKGYKVGDTIYIYRDGKLVSKVKITSSSTEVPVINEGGSYEVVIESEAGVKTSVVFTRAHIPNTASSILIIITILGIVMALFGGLIFRNRLKVDE